MQPDSKKFYKKQRHRPIKRLLKSIFPFIMACSIVFIIMASLFFIIPVLFFDKEGQMAILGHSLIALLISMMIILFGHFTALRRQSKFNPIRFRIKRKHPPFDR